MKKELTSTKIAVKNIVKHKRQYTAMILGIILAIVFSTATVLYFFSSSEYMHNEFANNFGKENAIISIHNEDEKAIQKLVDDGVVSDYGTAHLLGAIYKKSEEQFCEIAKLDSKAKEYMNLKIIEGSYPKSENEIAIEKSQLYRLGINASVGDKINLNYMVQNGEELSKAVSKTYTLCGIVEDKLKNQGNYGQLIDAAAKYIPGAFVSDNSKIQPGGKEKITAYCMFPNGKNDTYRFDEYTTEKLKDKAIDKYYTNEVSDGNNIFDNTNVYVFILIIVLTFASAIQIINSFQNNLKDRKKLIGTYRALGATKRQIFLLFEKEILLLCAICIPLGILLSYLTVFVIFRMTAPNVAITKNPIVIPIAIVFNFAVVATAASIPLLSASRISPMQAIRDINSTKKVQRKRIKSKVSYSAASLMAKRSNTFSSATTICVNLFLMITVVFSCIGFSYTKYENENKYNLNYDYLVVCDNKSADSDYNPYENLLNESKVGTAEKSELESLDYIDNCYGVKEMNSLMTTKVNKYLSCFSSITDSIYEDDFDIEKYSENHNHSEEYDNYKNELGGKDFVTVNMQSSDYDAVNELEKIKHFGTINMQKLSSGSEIILVAPKKITVAKRNNSNSGYEEFWDNQPIPKFYKIYATENCPYNVGDEVEISVSSKAGKNTQTKTVTKKVKIGAIISPVDISSNKCFGQNSKFTENVGAGLEFITTDEGLSKFAQGKKYDKISMFSNTPIDDTTDEQIMDYITSFAERNGCVDYASRHQLESSYDRESQTMLYSLTALIMICFVISASIVNSSLASRIRENRRQIGTVRAFGANMNVLTRSYIIQMLSMICPGIISGFAIFSVGYLSLKAASKLLLSFTFEFSYNPWFTLIFCILLCVICMLNLWIRLKKESKHSIIENIREM